KSFKNYPQPLIRHVHNWITIPTIHLARKNVGYQLSWVMEVVEGEKAFTQWVLRLLLGKSRKNELYRFSGKWVWVNSSFEREQNLAKKNELKARGTLLMALPDKHQLKFNIHKDNKSLMEAIKKRFRDLKQIDPDDLKEMDLKWKMAMLTMRAMRYHVVPPLYNRAFMHPKHDLVFTDASNTSESVANVFNVESSTNKPSKDMSKTLRPDAPIIEDWISDSEDETEIESVPKQRAPNKHVVNKAHSPVRRPINQRPATKNSNFNKKVTTVKVNKVTVVQGKIKTGKLDFDDVYFIKELMFNLFSVSQMCYKKNNDLFTDTECVVLSSDYKLPDENHVLLRVPRENNMYNVDLKNFVPLGDLTCIFAKDTLDESNLWHWRLGHISVKTMNKLVKGNLVRDLPSKIFENNHTCVACQKGKQHKGSYNDVADAAFDDKENENDVHVSANESDKSDNTKYDEKAKRDDKGKSHVDSPTGVRDLRDEFKEFSFNNINKVNAVSAAVTAAGLNPTNSTNSFNTASPSDTIVSLNFGIARKSSFEDPSKYPDDPEMPELKDIVYSDDEKDVGAEADLSNLETNILVSHIPTNRVHKDHLVNQIIGDLNSAPQIRSMIRMVKEQEPKKVHQELKDLSWIEAMQEELLQFKLQKGHTQEEGIDYDKVFAPVARIEAIRLFLAYASFMGFLVVKALYGLHQDPKAWYEILANYLLENGFQRGKIDKTLFIKNQKGDILLVQVYVDDIIFRSTNKEQCKAFEKLMKDKFQMSSLGELTFFLELQVKQKDDGIFISQDKYVAEILRKFGFTYVKSASTPIETEKPLLKDPNGEDVDVHIYRSMIGSLMYLTSSRPDIMFAVWACARFQVTLKVSHFYAVKRIFRCLKGKLHLGLWYPRDSLFNLVAYSDSNYARASLDRKSTIGGYQFLVTTAVVQLNTFDEKDGIRVTAGDLKLMLLGNLLLLFGLTKVGAVNLMLLVKKVNDIIQLHALINGKKVIVSEAIIRKDLHLDDANGVEYLPTDEIFMELARMGYEKPPPKLIFYKAFFSTQWKFFIHALVQCLSAKRTALNEFSFAELKQDKHSQALDILPLKKRVIKLEKKKRSKSSGFKRLRRVGTAQRVESSTNTILGAQEDASKQEGKIAAIDADEDITLVDVEKDEENMLEIVPVFKFKVEALQVKYPIIDWEIQSEGSRTYWKINRVGGITEAYQSFEDILKGFAREDLVALWNLKMHKGINVAGLSITDVGSRLMLLDKIDTAAEVLKNLL
nr:hypothetical protein [Tanacetum cinerariifolium]GEX67962.1 hypothetical protein [Tanacetum cinerariifolium]